jgi:hypothetical protein
VVEGSDSSSSSSSSSKSTATPSPKATKKSSSTVTLPSGVLGQTAAQKSCSVGNDLGKR